MTILIHGGGSFTQGAGSGGGGQGHGRAQVPGLGRPCDGLHFALGLILLDAHQHVRQQQHGQGGGDQGLAVGRRYHGVQEADYNTPPEQGQHPGGYAAVPFIQATVPGGIAFPGEGVLKQGHQPCFLAGSQLQIGQGTAQEQDQHQNAHAGEQDRPGG